jgi:uncharacterized protein
MRSNSSRLTPIHADRRDNFAHKFTSVHRPLPALALPVLLGVGVAFKIYYVTAWRRGESNFLESVLARAVFYSTLLTATAFGSLWISNQPGISSMEKLLALSLVCTLTSAALFQPALMGEPW